MLKRTLVNLGYTIRVYDLPEFKRAAGSLADVLLSHINEPLRVLDSAKEVHSPGSSGAADPSERPRTREEQELLTAFDDAATQATGSARARSREEARRAADERAQAAAKEAADRERQLLREALAKAEQDAERARREAKEAAEKAAERERQAAEASGRAGAASGREAPCRSGARSNCRGQGRGKALHRYVILAMEASGIIDFRRWNFEFKELKGASLDRRSLMGGTPVLLESSGGSQPKLHEFQQGGSN
jgi:hypothetical protein